MKISREQMALAIGFFGTLMVAVAAWALTTDQIWANWYDSATSSIKVKIVP